MRYIVIVVLAAAAGMAILGAVAAALGVDPERGEAGDSDSPVSTENTREPGEVSREWTEERKDEAVGT